MFKQKLVNFLKQDGLTVLIVLVLIGAYAVLRTPGDDFSSIEELEKQLTDGKPTVIEFYSNNCSICLINKPKVDQLERDLSSQASLLRLNVKDKVGLELATDLNVRGVPAFFVFDGAGNILYAQPGAPDIEAIKTAVAAAL